MTNCTNLSEDWKHYIGMVNSKGIVLTKEMLEKWEETDDGRLECVFCCTVHDKDTAYCRICHNYKGMQPYIAEWSDCNE
jgi:recombinational DNA repair protein RecR